MICVECASQVNSLYTVYSKDNIQATTCPNCEKFADKYIEYDPVLIALDVALLRPQAIRHVVFNRLKSQKTLLVRLHILVLLFDVYIKWACTELAPSSDATRWLTTCPTTIQYGFFLIASATEIVLVNLFVYLLMLVLTSKPDWGALFTTLLLSSMTKLLPLLTLIWDYDTSKALKSSLLLMGFTTAEFLGVTLECGYPRSLLITFTALGASHYLVESVLWPSIRG